MSRLRGSAKEKRGKCLFHKVHIKCESRHYHTGKNTQDTRTHEPSFTRGEYLQEERHCHVIMLYLLVNVFQFLFLLQMLSTLNEDFSSRFKDEVLVYTMFYNLPLLFKLRSVNVNISRWVLVNKKVSSRKENMIWASYPENIPYKASKRNVKDLIAQGPFGSHLKEFNAIPNTELP